MTQKSLCDSLVTQHTSVSNCSMKKAKRQVFQMCNNTYLTCPKDLPIMADIQFYEEFTHNDLSLGTHWTKVGKIICKFLSYCPERFSLFWSIVINKVPEKLKKWVINHKSNLNAFPVVQSFYWAYFIACPETVKFSSHSKYDQVSTIHMVQWNFIE